MTATAAVGLGAAVLLGGTIGLGRGAGGCGRVLAVVGGMEPPADPTAARAAGGRGAARGGPDGGLPGGRACRRAPRSSRSPRRSRLRCATSWRPCRRGCGSASTRSPSGATSAWPSPARRPRSQPGPRGGQRRVGRRRDATAGRGPAALGPRRRRESRARAVGVKAAVPLGVCLLPAFVLVGVVPLVAGSVSVLVGPLTRPVPLHSHRTGRPVPSRRRASRDASRIGRESRSSTTRPRPWARSWRSA